VVVTVPSQYVALNPMILCYGAVKFIIIYYIGNNMYTETVQALSIILEGYKNNLKKSNVNS